MKFKTQESYVRVQTNGGGKRITKQASKDACDINNIIARYATTRQLPITNQSGVYGDFSKYGSYQECVIKAQEAMEVFMQLPSKVRERFSNDPENLLKFIEAKKDNFDEGVKLGIYKAKKVNETNSEEPKEAK